MRFWLGRQYMGYCLWEGDTPPTYLGDEHGFNNPPENNQRGLVANLKPQQTERLFGVKLEMGQLVKVDLTVRVLEPA